MTPTFIHSHIVDYVILFHLRALQPPNWLAPWHCGVRVDSSNKLVGFIAAVPADVLIYETWVAHKYMQRCGFMWNLMSNISIHITFQQDCSNFPANAQNVFCREKRMVQVKFLCVHKKLRLKRMTPVLIRELTRRVNQQGLHQAVYTTVIVLPTPLSSCR